MKWVALLLLLLAGDDVAALAKKLKEPSEKERRAAVQELAKLATPPAWELVIEALKDTSPMVADEAQLQLGAVADVPTQKQLVGKKGLDSGDEWTRVRVAEALGRAPTAPDMASLSTRLDHKDPELRRALAWTIERLARAGKSKHDDVGELAVMANVGRMAIQDKDAGVRAAAVLASGALESDKQKPFAASLLGDKAAEVRCAALLDALAWSPIARFDAASKLVDDPALAVRAQSIDCLAACGTKRACQLLVERLEKEKNLRLRWRIVGELQRLAGSDLELNVPYWKKWVEGLDDAWAPKTGERSAPKEVKEQGTTVFMGLPVLSERVAILVDFSGSLWQKRENGKTRKETVDEELQRTLEKLSPQTRFNLIPYTNQPIPWEKALVPASKENVARALDFFVKCKATGKGNVWDAFELAWKDPEVDTILLLTDGAPTGGHRWNLELMRALFNERNRFHRVALDAILVDASKFLQDRWRALCEDNSGRMLAVEMK